MNEPKSNNSAFTLIAIAVLIVALAVGYYFVWYLPHKDNASLEQQRESELLKAQQEEKLKAERVNDLNKCLNDAQITYSYNWLNRCDSRGALNSECSEIAKLSINEYSNKLKTDEDNFVNKADSCSCSLPSTIANDVNSHRDRLNDECFKKYPQD